jgi:putative Holliday junction resolvase
MPKILSIDYGQARVGLAVTDPDGRVAFALCTVAWQTRDALFRQLLDVITSQAVAAIVVGYPARAGGDESLTGRQVRKFVARLSRRTDLPIALVDEAHSTEEAAEQLGEAGLSGRELLARVDAQAAAVILTRYLRGGALCCDPSFSDSSSSSS